MGIEMHHLGCSMDAGIGAAGRKAAGFFWALG
jgi:hypothetical protein